MKSNLEKLVELVESKKPKWYDGCRISVNVGYRGVYVKIDEYQATYAVGKKDDPINNWFTNKEDAINQALIETEKYLETLTAS